MIKARIGDSSVGLLANVIRNRIPQSGETVIVKIGDSDAPNFFLDFNDNTFKSSGWTTKSLIMAEDSFESGVYKAVWDSSLSVFGESRLFAIYEIESGQNKSQDIDDIWIHGDALESTSQLLLSGQTALSNQVGTHDSDIKTEVNENEIKIDSLQADTTAILADTSDMQPIVAANLDTTVSSRSSATQLTNAEANIISEVDANEVKIDAVKLVVDAIDTLTQTNLDATVSSRASSAQIVALSAIVALETTSQEIKTAVDEINLETDPAAIAAAVWNAILTSHTVAGSAGAVLSDANAQSTIGRKMLTNRLELFEGLNNNWILYDDDSTTPLLSFNVTDKNDLAISLADKTVAKRTKGV